MGRTNKQNHQDDDDSLQITTTLKGADAESFRAYKDRQFLKRDAEVARKLILERLNQESPAA